MNNFMPKQKMLSYHYQIQNLLQTGSVHAFFNAGRINDFYKMYKIKLDTLLEKINKLQNEFFEFHKDGNLMTTGEGKNQLPVFKIGKTKEEFDKEYNELTTDEPKSKIISLNKEIEIVK